MNDFIKKNIEDADNILIFAGAGMSADAGLNTFLNAPNEWKKKYQTLMRRYAFEYDFESAWEFYSDMVSDYANVEPHIGYYNLLSLLKNKNYFVVTTNVDELFVKAGYENSRVHQAHGVFSKMQCSLPCTNELFSLDSEQKKCPYCSRNLRPNIFLFDDAIERKIYDKNSSKNFRDWIDAVDLNSSSLVFELGVGAEGLHNNAIKYAQKLHAKHIVINPCPPTFVLKPKSYIIAKSIKDVFNFL